MKNVRPLIATLGTLLALFGASGQSKAQEGSVGLYGSERQSEAGAVPPEYDLVIVRYFAGSKNRGKVVDDIRRLASESRRVVVEFQFMASPDQRRAKIALPPVEKTASQLRDFLTQLEGVKLEGIALEEENRIQPERLAYLADLYKRTKTAFPKRRLLQWLAIGSRRTRAGLDINRFPADGFVVDPHLIAPEDYRELIDWLSDEAKPIYSVVWASPGWKVGGGARKIATPDWWNNSQWKIFYNRLAVNRHYGVDTLFFTFSISKDRSEPLALGNKCEKKFFKDLKDITVPYLKNSQIGMGIPSKRPDWIPRYC